MQAKHARATQTRRTAGLRSVSRPAGKPSNPPSPVDASAPASASPDSCSPAAMARLVLEVTIRVVDARALFEMIDVDEYDRIFVAIEMLRAIARYCDEDVLDFESAGPKRDEAEIMLRCATLVRFVRGMLVDDAIEHVDATLIRAALCLLSETDHVYDQANNWFWRRS